MSASSYPTPSSPDTPKVSTEESTAAKLERLSAAVVRAINARDFAFSSKEAQEVVAHLTPDWKARIDTGTADGRDVSWREQVAAWRARAAEFPDVHFDILDISSHVDEKEGFASVYLNMQVSGVESVVLHAMNELRWKRYGDDTWLCYYTIGMRGSVANSAGFA